MQSFRRKQWRDIIITKKNWYHPQIPPKRLFVFPYNSNEWKGNQSYSWERVRSRKEEEDSDSAGSGCFGKSVEKEARTKVGRAISIIHPRFSQFATNGDLQIKTTWEEKQERRKQQQRAKELEKSLIQARIEQKRVRGCAIVSTLAKATADWGETGASWAERDQVDEGADGGAEVAKWSIDSGYEQAEEDEQEAAEADQEDARR